MSRDDSSGSVGFLRTMPTLRASRHVPAKTHPRWLDFLFWKRLRDIQNRHVERQWRERLVFFGRLLHQQSFISATDGNLSVRLSDDRIMATPTGVSKGMMQPSDMVIVDRAGNRVAGEHNVSFEIDMHLTIYRRRPDVSAVVHAHPCTATAFASAGISLNEPLCSEFVMTLGSVPLAPYATTGTPEVSDSLLPFIGESNAILMANHGVVCYGKDLCQAYLRMEAVEHFARIVLATKQIGKQILLDNIKIQKLLEAKSRYLKAAAG